MVQTSLGAHRDTQRRAHQSDQEGAAPAADREAELAALLASSSPSDSPQRIRLPRGRSGLLAGRYKSSSAAAKATPAPSASEEQQAVAQEVLRQVEARLRGSIHDFSIEVASDHCYHIGGWCSSYHVKQMAQHLAMRLVSQGMLINEIQVRPPR